MKSKIYLGLLCVFSLALISPLKGQDVPYWQNQTPSDVNEAIANGVYPGARFSASMASYGADNGTGKVILFGGFNNPDPNIVYYDFNDTWSWSYDIEQKIGIWKDLTLSTANITSDNTPDYRNQAPMASDSKGKMILFGGIQFKLDDYGVFLVYSTLGDTWQYDAPNNVWTAVNTQNTPSPRGGGSMVYHAASDRYIMFGGYSVDRYFGTTVEIFNETWAFDLNSNTWTNVSPTQSPTARSGATMAVNSDGTIILFGGESSDGILGDTWRLTYDSTADTYNWNELTFTTAPTARTGASMVFDPNMRLNDLNIANPFILFGGLNGDYSNETWALSFANNSWSWTNLTAQLQTNAPDSYPAARASATMAFDFVSRQSILFAGFDESVIMNDTHSLIGTIGEPIIQRANQSRGFQANAAVRAKRNPVHLLNKIKLRAPLRGSPIACFRLLDRKHQLIGEVASDQRKIKIQATPCKGERYLVQSVDELGNVSAPVLVKIKANKRHCKSRCH